MAGKQLSFEYKSMKISIFSELERFQERGSFEFKQTDTLSKACNAPDDSSGIYLVFADKISDESLIYIGISGREGEKGKIIHRDDGIYGRIVKGKQFGKARRNSWPLKMKTDNIKTIYVKWFVTYGRYDQIIPRPIENAYLELILQKDGMLPMWNKEV
jgi:hypothetical protein